MWCDIKHQDRIANLAKSVDELAKRLIGAVSNLVP